MNNKEILTSNKFKKGQLEPKKEKYEMYKHKSHELYNQHSPKNVSNNNQNSSSNTNKSSTLVNSVNQIDNYSGAKNNNENGNEILNNKLNEINIYNNTRNTKRRKINKIDKNLVSNDEKFNISKELENNKSSNPKEHPKVAKSDKNVTKLIEHKKRGLNNVLSDTDSYQDIDSMEEENLLKENKIKNTKINIDMKVNNINNLKLEENNKNSSEQIKEPNYKRRLTAVLRKSNNNKKKSTLNKQKEKKNPKPKNDESHKSSQNKEDSDDDVIVNDNEFESSKSNENNNIFQTEFPQLSTNPFVKNKKHSLHRNKIKDNTKNIKDNEKEENINTNHHIKSSTLGTTNNISSSINCNSSNINYTFETLKNNLINENVNLNNSNKKEDKSNNFSNSSIEKDYRSLLLLAKKGDREKFLEKLGKILSFPKNLIDIDYKDENGYSALHYSCDEGNLKIVEILLKANCNVNLQNNEKETPLHLSSKRGYFDISKKLVEKGALINIPNNEKNSPLHYACMYNHIELINLFLSKSPQVSTKNIYGKMPVDLTTSKEIKELLDNYLNKNEKNRKIKLYESKIGSSKEKNENDNEEIKNINKNNINIHNDINKKKILFSPSSKNLRNKFDNKKYNYNSIAEFEIGIKKKNTLPNNLGFKTTNIVNSDGNTFNNNLVSLNNSNIKPNQSNVLQKININSVFKKNELKSNSKPKESSILFNIKMEPNNNNIKSKNYGLKDKNNNCLINGLKKTKTAEKFSSSNNDANTQNLYNSVNRKYVTSNDSKLNNSNILDNIKANNRINLSINRRNGNTNANNSVRKFNGNKNSVNIASTHMPKKKSKFIVKNSKSKNKSQNKKIYLESIHLSDKNLVNLNNTEEDIKKKQKKSKKGKNSLGKANTNNIKHIDGITKLLETSKIINKPKAKENKKTNQIKKEKNIDNSLINNCNTSKISCGQNKNNIFLESINKSNIVDQTLAGNIHNKLNLNSIDEEKITPSSFVCLAQLGKGSFGEVYLVQKINTQEKYAMKVLRKERIIGQNLLKYAIAERNVLSLSHHPFIVKLHFAFQTSTKLFLIMEYCPNGDLAKHLLFEKRFTEPRAKFYICEVLLALENLHKRDIIFRDLKPDNVVLDEEGHCKLTDFGLSKEGVNENQYAQSFCGSIAYLSPEMLKKQGHGKSVDWYLLGVLFYEMLVGITPYFTGRKEEIFHNIEFGELKIPNFVSPEAAGLLRGLLEKDPKKRLGGSIKDAQEIKEHPYFKDVDWDKVYNKKIKPPIFMNYMSKILHLFHRPRLFANDDLLNKSSDKQNPNNLMDWSFINNDEI